MRTFTINGRKYTAKNFGFNTIADLDDMGVAIEQAQKKQTSFIRAYFAVCAGFDKDTAGAEIEKHIIDGGNLNELSEVLAKEIEESDFFRSLAKTTETEVAESKAKKSK